MSGAESKVQPFFGDPDVLQRDTMETPVDSRLVKETLIALRQANSRETCQAIIDSLPEPRLQSETVSLLYLIARVLRAFYSAKPYSSTDNDAVTDAVSYLKEKFATVREDDLVITIRDYYNEEVCRILGSSQYMPNNLRNQAAWQILAAS